MQQIKKSHGFSLVEIVVGMAVGGLVIFTGVKTYDYFQKESARVNSSANSQSQVSSVGAFLKAKFGGAKSFQRLAIRFPSVGGFAEPRSSVGPGYAVYRNAGYDGLSLPSVCEGKFDNLNVVLGTPNTQGMKVVLPPGSGPTFKIGPITGTTSVSSSFAPGDLIVLSTVSQSEALYVPTSLVSPGNTSDPLTELSLNPYTQISLPGASVSNAKFANTYVAGDYVYRGVPYQLGVEVSSGSNECTGKLKFGRRAFSSASGLNQGPDAAKAEAVTVVAEGLTQFKASPILETDLSDCPALKATQPAVDLTSDTQVWKAIHSDNSGKCYLALKGIKLTYGFKASPREIAGRAGASTAPTEITGEYVFQSNK